jgi:hypothetical protein
MEKNLRFLPLKLVSRHPQAGHLSRWRFISALDTILSATKWAAVYLMPLSPKAW